MTHDGMVPIRCHSVVLEETKIEEKSHFECSSCVRRNGTMTNCTFLGHNNIYCNQKKDAQRKKNTIKLYLFEDITWWCRKNNHWWNIQTLEEYPVAPGMIFIRIAIHSGTVPILVTASYIGPPSGNLRILKFPVVFGPFFLGNKVPETRKFLGFPCFFQIPFPEMPTNQ